MSDSTTPTSSTSGKWLRIGIIGLGSVVFLLLLFADKTNLNNPDQASAVSSEVPSQANKPSALPPLAPDPKLDGWVAALTRASSEEKKDLLDSIAGTLVERNRFGYAANYLEQKVEKDRSLEVLKEAGIMNQKATELSYVMSDTALFRTFSDRAIQYLSEVAQSEPEDEEGLLYLGLALAQSRKGQNTMQGILTIRKVLEINPDNIEAGLRLGMFSLQTNQLDKAAQRFGHILSIEPDNQLARLQLGVTRIRQERAEEAQALLEQVIQESSDAAIKLEARDILLSLNTK